MKSKQANKYIVDTNLQEIIVFQIVFALWQFAMLSYNNGKRFIDSGLIVTMEMSQKPEDYSDLVVLACKINLPLSSEALGQTPKCWAHSSEKSYSDQIAPIMKKEAFWFTLPSCIKIVWRHSAEFNGKWN